MQRLDIKIMQPVRKLQSILKSLLNLHSPQKKSCCLIVWGWNLCDWFSQVLTDMKYWTTLSSYKGRVPSLLHPVNQNQLLGFANIEMDIVVLLSAPTSQAFVFTLAIHRKTQEGREHGPFVPPQPGSSQTCLQVFHLGGMQTPPEGWTRALSMKVQHSSTACGVEMLVVIPYIHSYISLYSICSAVQ